MKYSRIFIATLTILLNINPSVIAQVRKQPPAVLGVGAGYDYGYAVPITGDLTNTSYSNYAEIKWAGLNLTFPKLFTQGFGLSTTLSYGTYFLHGDGTNPTTFMNGTGNLTRAQTNINYDLTTKAAQMDLMAYIQMGRLARFEIGSWGGIGFLQRYQLDETIVGSDTITFANGTRTRFESEEVTDGFLINAGLGLRASLEIPFFFGTALVPAANLRVAYTMPQGDDRETGIVGTAGLSLTMMFDRPEGEDVPAPPPVVIDSTPEMSMTDTVSIRDTVVVASISSLKAEVDLYSSTDDGRRTDTLLLSPRRTLHRVEVPMSTTFRFEQASASLPVYYTGNSAAHRADFSQEALAGLPPLDLHRQRLNIIGTRMLEHPNATLTINGSISKGEPKWFAEARAVAVKKYLTDAWGISSSRITTASIGGRSAGAQVVITSTSPEIMAPIVAEWIEQQIDAAPIGVEPRITSQGGPLRWRISVTLNNREIGVVRNTDVAGSASIDAGLLVRSVSIDSAIAPLHAELVVEDSTGVTIAHDLMPIVIPHGVLAIDEPDREISTYLVLGNSRDLVQQSVDHIVERTKNGATVTLQASTPSRSQTNTASNLASVAEQLRSAYRARGTSHVNLRIDDHNATQTTDDRIGDVGVPVQVAVEQQVRR